MKNIQILINAYMAYIAHIITLPFLKKKIWIIGGMGGKLYADNSKTFYEYLLNKHSEIAVFWVANKNSSAAKLTPGSVLEKGSFKNFFYFYKSQVSIFSDTFNTDIAPMITVLPILSICYKRNFKVRLNHGTISFKKMPGSSNPVIQKIKDKILLSFNLSTAATPLEVEVMSGYMREGTVVLTGSARNDDVLDLVPKEPFIFIAPTWRPWLHTLHTLKNTEFFQAYSTFLANPTLHQLLRDNNLKIHFVLHHMFIQFMDEFREYESDVIAILPTTVPLRDEIIGSSLMITDYSSICSERYYLNKPVLFYQFDREEYSEKIGSYIDLKHDTFGEVAVTPESLIQSIESYINNGFCTSKAQQIGTKYFVHFRDQQNCERIYAEIEKRLR